MTSADQEQAGSGEGAVMVRKTIQQCIDELRRSEHSAGMVANWLEPIAAEMARAREQIRTETDRMLLSQVIQLKADLERVTAELAEMKVRYDEERQAFLAEQVATREALEELADVETERDAALAVVEAAKPIIQPNAHYHSPATAWCSSPQGCNWKRAVDALAALDATRKATGEQG